MKPESDAQVSNTLTYLFWPVQTAINTQSEKTNKKQKDKLINITKKLPQLIIYNETITFYISSYYILCSRQIKYILIHIVLFNVSSYRDMYLNTQLWNKCVEEHTDDTKQELQHNKTPDQHLNNNDFPVVSPLKLF